MCKLWLPGDQLTVCSDAECAGHTNEDCSVFLASTWRQWKQFLHEEERKQLWNILGNWQHLLKRWGDRGQVTLFYQRDFTDLSHKQQIFTLYLVWKALKYITTDISKIKNWHKDEHEEDCRLMLSIPIFPITNLIGFEWTLAGIPTYYLFTCY